MAVYPLDHRTSCSCRPASSSDLHELGDLYDLYSAILCSSPDSHRKSLQLRGRASMDFKGHASTSTQRNSSSPPTILSKRSVAGMKSLLPLKLLSPTLPECDFWPSSKPMKRSTFGTKIPSRHSGQSSEVGDRARDSLESRKKSRHNRDMPIYNPPGSPIPSRAYFSEDDISFNCPQPGSLFEAERILQDFACSKGNEQEVEVDDVDNQEDNAQQSPHTVRNKPRRPSEQRTPRWSELSFKCSGDLSYQNESVLSGNANDEAEALEKRLDEEYSFLPTRTVESWLSDTSSSFEHEEILASATVLSPSRGHVIDHSPSSSPPSGLAPIHIPARSSSLMGTCFQPASFWETFGTPPLTPDGPIGDSGTPQSFDQINTGMVGVPPQSMGYSAPSPPLSPHPLPLTQSRAVVPQLEKRAAMPISIPELDVQWPLPPSSHSQHSLMDIISSLEASTSNFPSSILLPDVPCIHAIRLRDARHSLTSTSLPIPALSLKALFGHEFPLPPSTQPTSKPKPKPFKFPSHRDSLRDNVAILRSSSLPTLRTPSDVSPPNLTPLRRIFPRTTDFMRSTLYAHIIAHNFVVSQAALLQSSPAASPLGHRRTVHRLSPKAAGLLGIILQDSNPIGDSIPKQLQFKIRLQALQQTLRQCIYSLTSAMDSGFGIEDVPEIDDNTMGCSNGKLFIRTLEEVVKSCEVGFYGMSGMV